MRDGDGLRRFVLMIDVTCHGFLIDFSELAMSLRSSSSMCEDYSKKVDKLSAAIMFLECSHK